MELILGPDLPPHGHHGGLPYVRVWEFAELDLVLRGLGLDGPETWLGGSLRPSGLR